MQIILNKAQAPNFKPQNQKTQTAKLFLSGRVQKHNK